MTFTVASGATGFDRVTLGMNLASRGDTFIDVYMKYFDNVVCGTLSLVCVATSCLSMAVFLKQGLKDSVNISLVFLVFWDLLKGLSGLIMRLNVPLWFNDTGIGNTWDAVMTAKFAYFQTLSNYVSYPIAAYISVERALCVSVPFQVKGIITPKLTASLMVAISFIISAMFIVIFFIYDVVLVFDNKLNTTITAFVYSQLYLTHGYVILQYYNLIGIINPILSLIIMVTSTIIITYNLRNSSEQFRTQQTQPLDGKQSTSMSKRNRKVVRMLLVIIVIFNINLVPRIAHQLAKLVEPEYYVIRKYSDIFAVCVVMVYIFDFTNACTNFFVFMTMSSAFKATFLQIFPACKVILVSRRCKSYMTQSTLNCGLSEIISNTISEEIKPEDNIWKRLSIRGRDKTSANVKGRIWSRDNP